MAEQHSDRPAPVQHPAEHDGQHEPRAVTVVVTYNRRDLLPKTLAGIASGRMRPVAVVIVDNASTDDTAAYLDSLEYDLPVDRITPVSYTHLDVYKRQDRDYLFDQHRCWRLQGRSDCY